MPTNIGRKISNPTIKSIAALTAMAIAGLLISCAHSQSAPLSPAAPSPSPLRGNVPVPIAPPLSDRSTQLVYQPATPPQFKNSSKLQSIVDQIVADIRSKKLPTKPLSISLIDVKTQEIAGFQPDNLRYPASVVKLFWMVNLEAQTDKGTIERTPEIQDYLNRMLEHSDNDAAAAILDRLTDTRSQKKLSGEQYRIWWQKRQTVNNFFQLAGYDRININQKTFPVYSIGLASPQGTDLQMRGNPRAPIRNKITTNHAARLIYEIFQRQAVSASASQRMQTLLTRNLDPGVWKNKNNYPGFNPVRGFLGEGLADTKVKFASKAGWTSSTRGEAAYISDAGSQRAYVLAIIGDDRAYANNSQLFPQISRFVYSRLTKLE